MSRRKQTHCNFPSCERQGPTTRGWCRLHYIRWLTHGDPSIDNTPTKQPPKPCTVAGCTKPRKGHGYCLMHYTRFRKHGDALYEPSPRREVVLASIEKSDGCWHWTGCIGPAGYGVVRYEGRNWRAHRLVYQWLVGPIPEGLTLDHLCHSTESCPGGVTCPHRRCVNPAHLKPVTIGENVRRVWPTSCPHGHPYDESNTRHGTRNGYPTRQCRECSRVRDRRRRAQVAS